MNRGETKNTIKKCLTVEYLPLDYSDSWEEEAEKKIQEIRRIKFNNEIDISLRKAKHPWASKIIIPFYNDFLKHAAVEFLWREKRLVVENDFCLHKYENYKPIKTRCLILRNISNKEKLRLEEERFTKGGRRVDISVYNLNNINNVRSIFSAMECHKIQIAHFFITNTCHGKDQTSGFLYLETMFNHEDDGPFDRALEYLKGQVELRYLGTCKPF